MKKLFFIFFLLNTRHIKTKIKVYCQYTDTHEVLLNDFFLPSIKDDFDIIVKKFEQKSKTGAIYSLGYHETMVDKTQWILELIQQNWEEYFLFSDVDIQFFKSCENLLHNAIKNKDIVFQPAFSNNSKGICAGFFIMRCNRKTLELWTKVKNILLSNPKTHDQSALGGLVDRIKGLKWGLLPDCFWNKGILDPTIWKPGMKLYVPKNIVMHHACYSIGITDKIQQLQEVKKILINESN